MAEQDELIKIGRDIIDRYKKMACNGDNRTDWQAWVHENIYSCQILIELLQRTNPNYEHILFLSKLIGEHHKNSKPPAIFFWTNKIAAYIQNQHKGEEILGHPK